MSGKKPSIRIAVIAAVYLSVSFMVGTGLVDDTYIFLRYARNLVAGHGPVFNVGERVEGYTSPLWLASLTPISWLSGRPEAVVGGVSAAIGFLTAVLVSRRSFIGALAVAAHPGYVFWVFSGMETALVACTLTLTFLALLAPSPTRRSSLMAGFAFAGACLARPDSVVLGPVAVGLLWHQSGNEPGGRKRNLLSFLIPMAAVALHEMWRFSYYGSWLPNTAYAKAGVGSDTLLAHGLAYLPDLWLSWMVIWCALLVSSKQYLGLAAALSVVWSLLILAIGGDFFPFARFGVPLLPVLASLVTGDRWLVSRRWLAVGVVAGSAVLLAGPDKELAARELRLASGWKQSGIWLNEQLPPDSTIATLVAGSLPYYAQRPTIDLLGLTDEHIGRRGQIDSRAHVGHQRSDANYVLSRRPDVIVLQDSGRWSAPRFKSDEWPHYRGGELPYVRPIEDLLNHTLTKSLYEYRAHPLRDGTYLEALWLKTGHR